MACKRISVRPEISATDMRQAFFTTESQRTQSTAARHGVGEETAREESMIGSGKGRTIES
jgi:hypothetical protein